MKYVFLIIVTISISFAITALLVKGICWAFGLAFSFKIAFGVWLVLFLIKTVMRGSKE